jgi:osmotically inducible lipoprotein OsmB
MDAAKVAAIASGKQGSTESKARKAWRYCAGTLALIAGLSLAGCYGPPLSPRAEGTLIGGAVGAGGGALVGSTVGSPLAGAALGGLGGAGVGYLIGNQAQHQGYGGYGGYRGYRGYQGYRGSRGYGDDDDD